jgi:hydroxylamine reductase (hybrid-cluster protein)
MGKGKNSRGRLSSIDQLPVEANPAIQWAASEIIENSLTQDQIREELNRQLADIAREQKITIEPISRSAFNRYSTRTTALTRQLAETREVARTVAEALGPDAHDDATILLVQLIKQASIDIFQKKALSSKEIMELSRALNSAMAAQKSSAENKEREEEKQRRELEKAAEVATNAILEKDPKQDANSVLNAIREAYGIGGTDE